MVRTAIKPRLSPTRCPFCHDGVGLQEPWVVCRGCLARHHSECWSLNGACSSCGRLDVLKDSVPPAFRVRLAGQSHQRGFRRLEHRFSPWTPITAFVRYLSSVASAGLVPVLWAEAGLRRHLRSSPGESSTRALRASTGRSQLVIGIFVVALGLACAGAALLNNTIWRDDGFGSAALGLAGTTWVLTLLGLLGAHHRAVRRHDSAQLSTRAKDLDATRQYELAERHTRDWASTGEHLGRATAFTLAFSSLCFPIAFVIFPLCLARAFQVPLELHERRLKLGDLGS